MEVTEIRKDLEERVRHLEEILSCVSSWGKKNQIGEGTNCRYLTEANAKDCPFSSSEYQDFCDGEGPHRVYQCRLGSG